MGIDMGTSELAFTDERIVNASDIAVLREAYVQLLGAYHEEVRGRVLAEMRLEDLEVVEVVEVSADN